ncbi:MAG TPA: hypothetical protein VIV40_09590 [Kofleriaceae bacterium]
MFALTGCINEFSGSELQIDFGPAVPPQASAYRLPFAGELPANIHFTLYAFNESMTPDGMTLGNLFELQQFEIHRIVDLESPCFIDVGEHVPFPGLHVSQYAAEMAKKTGITDLANPPASATEDQKIDAATAVQRQRNAEAMAGDTGPKAITSVSPGAYDAVDASCSGNGIPPPECVEPAENQRRLDKCQTAWNNDRFFFEGTDRVLTAPLNGTTYGMVIGTNPVNMAPIGGSAFFVDESLAEFTGYALYWQYDDVNHDGTPDYPPSVPAAERTKLGTLYMFGHAEKPTRGVIRTHLANLVDSTLSADLAVFANIDQDDVHF